MTGKCKRKPFHRMYVSFRGSAGLQKELSDTWACENTQLHGEVGESGIKQISTQQITSILVRTFLLEP